MDDFVCPLCCEELDLSDREFYPCKCGYQVCMWCWHRIRESETGLCPACRTPYGEDPHQFSAVDVEEAIKQNKKREAAAKRERQKQNHHTTTSFDHHDYDESHSALDAPKDRSQLANLRVIRRNLVYAVGFPLNIATEEILRKPEYFGQYGKISKIVINRSQATAPSDPRRASASAYVTFVHKDDALACILALDGFYLDNRSVRVSFGTSKYCSAFIKCMKCNNPECTYLHEMGSMDDTFTKQEILAGYVTSGRDVEARQQQIVEEQLQLTSGSNGASGADKNMLRKRVGGGGPSGTGRHANTPVFPPPEYTEAAKPPPPMLPAPQAVAQASRTMSAALSGPSPSKAAAVRSMSLSITPNALSGVRKSAASIVAGSHASAKTEDANRNAVPLTPLKRSKSTQQRAASVTANVIPDTDIPPFAKFTSKKNSTKNTASGSSTVASSNSLVASGLNSQVESVASIGGDIIGPAPPIPSRINELGGDPIVLDSISGRTGSSSSLLGGDLFTGYLPGQKPAIGSNVDKWHSSLGSTKSRPQGQANMNDSNGTDIWSSIHAGGDGASHFLSSNTSLLSNGGGSIGPIGSQNHHLDQSSRHAFGGNTNDFANNGNSTSTLATILGINLPTGSGSLQENSSIWPVGPTVPTPLSSLNNSALPLHNVSSTFTDNNSLDGSHISGMSGIGGQPIGGAPIGNQHNGSGKSDIAMLQSLLPGVHITSGNEIGNDWSSGLGNGLYHSESGWGSSNGNGKSNTNSNNKVVGAIGQQNGSGNRSGIW